MVVVVCRCTGVLWHRRGTRIAAKVLHVTNQGQSVQKRVKERMKGRSFGLVCNPPPPL